MDFAVGINPLPKKKKKNPKDKEHDNTASIN